MPGVYISYPFCAQKCTYCNFASGVFPRQLEAGYMAGLRREIAGHPWAWRPETAYLGGGTPSLIGTAELRGLLDLLPGRPWRECTIEAAPGTVTRERAEAWRRSGVNRVSLGVQSFVQPEIARAARKHTAAMVAEEVALLRDSGIRNINMDLIAGLPGQSRASWGESLDWIERLAPEHVSVYMLEVDEASRLGREILGRGARYGAKEAPAEELVTELYLTAVERLERQGIRRYEISNFAQAGYESRHNLKYWRLEPYVGFGADAHSFDGRERRRNVESAVEYAGAAAPAGAATAASADERLILGLRLERGVEPEPEEWRRLDAPIRRFLDTGLLERDGRALRLTGRGVLLSNEVFQEFLL
ncbi:MAG: coproporphyrinogen III oxidase family protein [Acidobacteria bacterium]|nr:coproporphyrinogen III oxidase family protein [Acidobacteriota bacterium]